MTSDWLNVHPHDLTVAVAGALIVSALAWFGRRVNGWIALLNDQWTLRWISTELERLQALKNDPAGVVRMMLHHAVWMLLFLGVSLMFSLVDISNNGSTLAHLIRFGLGSLTYIVGVHALGTYNQATRDVNKAIERLENRILILQKKRQSSAGS